MIQYEAMEVKEKSDFTALIKKIIYSLGIIFSLSISMAAAGTVGHFLIENKPFEQMWVLPFVGGTFLYLIGYIILLKIRRGEKLKAEFITVAAHNLRTPLTKIQWLITDLEGKIQDPQMVKRFANMKETFKSLTMIVHRLLEISEAGKTSMYFSYAFEDHRFEYIILQSTADYSVGIKQKNISLNTRIQEGLPMVKIDKDRMQLAVNIFMENAILYNKRDGSIDIDVYQKKDALVCSIKNTGIGISKEDLPKIFTKFYRTREAITKDTDRVGLGLSLAKEIISKHKGKVYVESEGKGMETSFWFTLPISKVKKD